MFDILRPFLFKINPETAHSLAINALKFGNIASIKINKSPRIETSIFNKKIHCTKYDLKNITLTIKDVKKLV